ncbi:MAG: hypothetical protein JXQ79_12710, partial [Rhodobacteraceae bacterium]|nr:hypothetical protein [Paracoccaceae bacterium]
IDPADWDKGADHVNALIQRIVAEHKPKPKAKAPPAVVERVKAFVPINAATLALQLHSLIETIAQEREHLRGLNAFSADEKQGLHDALDNLASTARHLLDLLPEKTALSDQTAEDMASWAIVLKDQAQHWNTEAKKVVSGKPADDRVAFTGRLIFAAAVAAPLSLMGLGSFAAVAGGAILLKDKLDVQKVKDAIRSVTSSQ